MFLTCFLALLFSVKPTDLCVTVLVIRFGLGVVRRILYSLFEVILVLSEQCFLLKLRPEAHMHTHDCDHMPLWNVFCC